MLIKYVSDTYSLINLTRLIFQELLDPNTEAPGTKLLSLYATITERLSGTTTPLFLGGGSSLTTVQTPAADAAQTQKTDTFNVCLFSNYPQLINQLISDSCYMTCCQQCCHFNS